MTNDTSTTAAVRWMLAPLSAAYAGVIRARNLYYDRVDSSVRHAELPVISVGNITVGGTGKTPLVIEVVRRLRETGRRPAVLTRGYKAEAGKTADEVKEFEAEWPGVPVIVNPDRVAGARTARDGGEVDCLVLDDGFQHRRLARDLDIVLIDALSPWGGGKVLPGGRLREPLRSLRRADIFVLTRVNQVEPAVLKGIRAGLRRWGRDKPVCEAAVRPVRLALRDGREMSPAEIGGRSVLLVSGIGNPATFEKLVVSLGPKLCAPHAIFADHHRFTQADAAGLAAEAAAAQADLVVTTRKDWVKLASLWPDDAADLARLDVELALVAGADEFEARLQRALEKSP